MDSKEQVELTALMAARDAGISTMLFRNALAKSLDLNLTESLCLTLLGIRAELSPSMLSRVIGLTTGSTTTMLDRLEKRGFIRRKANALDRRGILIELTAEYQTQAQKMVVGVQKAHRELLRRYSPEQLRIITDFLHRFTRNLMDNAEDVRTVFDDSTAD